MLEGVGSIVEGMNPKLIRIKLEPSLESGGKKESQGSRKADGRRRRARGREGISRCRPKKQAAEHENHERWLVSYADFITLLFAFFVVMFASSQTDKSQAKQVSEAVEKALNERQLRRQCRPAVAKILGGTVDDKGQGNAQMKGPGGAQRAAKEAPPPDVVELVPSLKSLTKELEEEIKAGKVEVHLEPRGLVVSLKQSAFFPSGTDSIDPATYPIIAKLAARTERRLRIRYAWRAIPIPSRSTPPVSAAIGSCPRPAASP